MQQLMYCINVKEKFNVRFMDKGNHISQQRYHMFQARSVFEVTCIKNYYLLRILAMLSFSVTLIRNVIISVIEIGVYLVTV